MKKSVLLLFLIISVLGCVEDFDFKLQKAEPRLVVEGLITNQKGPYYVRLTKSMPGGLTTVERNYSQTDNAIPVKDAIVTISDDNGQCDTLKYIIINLYPDVHKDDIYNQGFYATQKLQGIPGHTYTLKITWEGKEFVASAFMPPVPKVDSLSYRLKKSEMVGKSDYYIPLLYFKEPQDTVNYYLFQLQEDLQSRIFSSVQLWQFSVLSDTYLEPYVNGLNISRGATPRGIDFLPVYGEGQTIYVALSSLTKEAYSYYKNLLEQFESDGGAYKPAPASPPGNISNGGLGFFRASAVSEARTDIKITHPMEP
ncbi:MAG TPA: DUF4249 domain-containing protein [Prolixibacteraceae bacterium]|nr:DUF4249 domain-containing protein [Prolixibacteraceae bacterium]